MAVFMKINSIVSFVKSATSVNIALIIGNMFFGAKLINP